VLRYNTTVKHLIIIQRKWDPKELKEFLTCLSCVNRGVTSLELAAHDFEPSFMETLTKILKLNRQIKRIQVNTHLSKPLFGDGWKRFCDGMEYYTFEELFISNALLPAKGFELLVEGLIYNQSIKSLCITAQEIGGKKFKAICDLLVSNPTITRLDLVGCVLRKDDLIQFKRVLNANSIKKLRLQHSLCKTKESNLDVIENELKANTSITELYLPANRIDYKLIGDIIRASGSIKKLDMGGNKFSVKHLKLKSNRILQDLNLENCLRLNYSILFKELCKNQSLKILRLGNNSIVDNAMLTKFLTKNNTLMELVVYFDYMHLVDETIKAIASGLAGNKSLRKLSFKISRMQYNTFSSLIDALKSNHALLELHISNIKNLFLESRPPNGNDMDDFLLDLLKTNKTLRYIEGAEEFPYLEEIMKANRERQDKIIADTIAIIKMIIAKPNSFILPVEVWEAVFKNISYSFTPLDFEQFFKSNVK